MNMIVMRLLTTPLEHLLHLFSAAYRFGHFTRHYSLSLTKDFVLFFRHVQLDCTFLIEIRNCKFEIDNQAQYNRSENFKIHGISYKSGEDIFKITKDLGSLIAVRIHSSLLWFIG